MHVTRVKKKTKKYKYMKNKYKINKVLKGKKVFIFVKYIELKLI